ncbi:GNAT family N-acetyltransferase [Brevundimonas sp. 2R-24]|uniref:GNAT family N-acetyltransferase n=1 Tax=Peiella sedimenti TaxID=3061083 RepID=A0ABT8SPE3_9CAUL|nr:GNAT family N-acetyltransferase [Caulobacteraceae bacterium XZ-24]
MGLLEPQRQFETRRLRLRPLLPQDAPVMAAFLADAGVARMTCSVPHPFTLADADAFIAAAAAGDPRRQARFAIEHEDHGLVGGVGFTHPDGDAAPEVGYWIGRPFWGRGFATEALEGALAWARRRWGRRAVMAGHFADNPASGRVLEKAGFLYTGERHRLLSRARGEAAEARMMVWLA